MRILFATGIFKPEIGGPATYVPNLASELVKLGHKVKVVTYSDKDEYDFDQNLGYKISRIKRRNIFLNYLRYFLEIMKNIKNFDLVYTFDYFSAGIPCLMAIMLSRKKLISKTGGDLIWERHLSSTGDGITMSDFYKKNVYKKYFFKLFISNLFFKKCDLIIFNTKFQGEIFKQYYKISNDKIKYLYNPIIKVKNNKRININNEIIWAGRMEVKNNIKRLVKVFCEMSVNNYKLILIGQGSLKKELTKYVKEKGCNNIIFKDIVLREKLIEILKVSYGMILPSYTDISPNLALECLSVKVPFILTKEHGIECLRGKVIEFDPISNIEMKNAIEKMLQNDFEDNFKKFISNVDYNYSYEKTAKDTINMIKETIK